MRTTIAVASLTSLMVACAGYGPPASLRAGSTEAEVVQAMGQPTGRYQLPEGPTRLEFARGPYGRHTYMVDLDAQGRVMQIEQVLDRRYFEGVSPGITKDQLLRYIGRPSEVQGMMRNGQIWSYRYANNDCLWWQAQLDAQGIVTAVGYASAPGCDGRNDALGVGSGQRP
jgi:outer membrane protein assembly factor BamE (lipoprotein component of BamABCDE complex)